VICSFRRTTRSDFALLETWLTDPVVHRWWHHETSPEAIERDFGPVIDAAEPAEDFIALVDELPVGLIQRCRWEDYPEERDELEGILEVPAEAMTIDYLIGLPQKRGHGVGTALIGAFVEKLWLDVPTTSVILVPVAAGNVSSWRALEKAGFRRVASGDLEPDNPIDPPLHFVLRLDR
jgi:aminoglycoside 6'-N-acetyltransferase